VLRYGAERAGPVRAVLGQARHERTGRPGRLGAERVQKVQTGRVTRNPADLVFCVLPVSPGSLNYGNARRWE
jgi:hypothetical protein